MNRQPWLPGVLILLAGAGCSRYDNFRLPRLSEEPKPVSLRWEIRPAPVLGKGAPGDWDGVDALNPSVVTHQSRYFNFYSGFDGKTWHTGLATSADGLSWTKEGRVLSPGPAAWEGSYIAANGSALRNNGEFLYWFQAGNPPRIGLARSADGKDWSKLPQPVLDTGPRGSWDELGVADPSVERFESEFYMFYLGQDRAQRQRLGVARSPDGVTWWKLRSNPVLELGEMGTFDEAGLGEPAVWAAFGQYWMLYTGRDRAEHRALGLARSRDGIGWEREDRATVLRGQEAWNRKVICDPSVEVTPKGVRVWFGGGDAARPDENLNGQIGFAVLHLGPKKKVDTK